MSTEIRMRPEEKAPSRRVNWPAFALTVAFMFVWVWSPLGAAVTGAVQRVHWLLALFAWPVCGAGFYYLAKTLLERWAKPS